MVQFPKGKWLSVAEAADRLNVSRRRVQALASGPRKKLDSMTWGGRVYVSERSVAAYEKSPRQPGRPAKRRKS